VGSPRQEALSKARHIWFSKVDSKDFGVFSHPEVPNLWREHVKHYNAYVEITK